MGTTTMGKRRDEIFPQGNELECLSMPPPFAVCGLDIVGAFEPVTKPLLVDLGGSIFMFHTFLIFFS